MDTNHSDAPDPARLRALTAVLELSGEHGYRHVTVEQIAVRSGDSVEAFYSRFADKQECFALAYRREAGALLVDLLDAAAASSGPRPRLRAALGRLVDFVAGRPCVARAILGEVYVAGGDARAEHYEALERLSRAVADACRETDPSRHSPPPMTALFIVGGIEEVVRRRLVERRQRLLREELPTLVAFATAACLDE